MCIVLSSDCVGISTAQRGWRLVVPLQQFSWVIHLVVRVPRERQASA